MDPREKHVPELDELDRLARALGERVETLMLGLRYRSADGRESFANVLRRARDYVKLALSALEARPGAPSEDREGAWLRERVARLTGNLARGAYVSPSGASEEGAPPAPSPRSADNPGFSGDTSSIAIPDLLNMLQMQEQTGTLTVSLAHEDVCLEFAKGELVHAYSRNTPPGQRLGEILVRRGVIAASQLDDALRGASGRKARLGDAIRTLGLAKEAELRAALDEQIQNLFHRLLAATRAAYVFREGASHTADRARVNLMQLLLESSRKLDESTSVA